MERWAFQLIGKMSKDRTGLCSQYNQLISRRIQTVLFRTKSHKISADEGPCYQLIGIVLSGGPNLFNEEGSLILIQRFLNWNSILGICHGMQLLTQCLEEKHRYDGNRELFNNQHWPTQSLSFCWNSRRTTSSWWATVMLLQKFLLTPCLPGTSADWSYASIENPDIVWCSIHSHQSSPLSSRLWYFA